MNKILLTLFNHERYQSITFIIAFALMISLYSCEPQTTSIINPTQKVTSEQLTNEINYLVAQTETKIADLEKKKAFRDSILRETVKLTTSGNLNVMGIMTNIAAIVGLGATIDNARKRKVIKRLETNLQTTDS